MENVRTDIHIEMPMAARMIINTLEENGFEGYVVGGCVRDTLLGRVPEDWDITTSAKPEQVKALFRRTVDTGIQHGTVTVMVNHVGYEVTTFRIDGEYEDARHPKDVEFTENLKEDLLRRDFTINAMAYNDRRGLVDCFGGIEDLHNKVIRCVGVPQERFTEDALRIMRAVRFSAQLGFAIEENTAAAAKELAPNLKIISVERVQAELVKLLTSDHPGELRRAYEIGITAVILPDFDRMMQTPQNNPHHQYNVGEHTIHAVENAPCEKCIRIAMLLHDFGKPDCKTTDENGIDHFYGHPARSEEMAHSIMKRLKFDNDTIRTVCALVRNHDMFLGATEAEVRKCISRVGTEIYPRLFDVKRADMLAQSMYHREEKEQLLAQSKAIYDKVLQDGDPVSLKMLAVTGNDLIKAGIRPGRGMGEILDKMLEDVIEDPSHNTKEYLLGMAEKYLQIQQE